MGTPVKIDDLARNMIRLSGLKPDEDIQIIYTGLRPGEKLFEERLMDEEGMTKTSNKLINIGKPKYADIGNLWVESGGIRVKLVDADGNVIQNDYESLIDWIEDEEFTGWWYSDDYFQEPGSYTYYIVNSTDMDWDLTCDLYGYTRYAKKGTFSKAKTVKRDDWVKIGRIGTGYPRVTSFKSSKSKIIKDYYIESDGSVYVLGKALGKTNRRYFLLEREYEYGKTVETYSKSSCSSACCGDYRTSESKC